MSFATRAADGSNTLNIKDQIGPQPLQSAESTSRFKIKNHSQADQDSFFKGQLRLESMQYLTPLPKAPQLTNSQLLTTHFLGQKTGSLLGARLDLTAGTFFYRSQSHVIFHEAFIFNPRSEKHSFSLGRQKQHWSVVDELWQLGLWQPKFALDALRPQEQGLLGLFYNYQPSKYFSMLLFSSPIFVPNMGPQIREEGGNLVSDSRWYTSPSSEYSFNNRVNSVVYKLDIPDQTRLASQYSSAIQLVAGAVDSGPWVQGSYANKPVNELLLKRQAFKSTSESKVDVTVSPLVTRHRISSVDLGYSWRGGDSFYASEKENFYRGAQTQLILSYLEDQPNLIPAETDWSVQKLEDLKIYSGTLMTQFRSWWLAPIQLHLSYLRTEGGQIQDIVSDGSNDDFTLFDERLKFKNAFFVQVKTPLWQIWGRPLLGQLKWAYDDFQKGSLWSGELDYSINKNWQTMLGFDVLGVQDEAYKPASFLNQFRANDRVYGGMAYVF
ncbi:MAG: transposase [Pseudobdellovibrionaceae bacterium]